MAYSYEVTVSAGITPNVTVPFQYLEKGNVHVKLDGTLVPDEDLAWSSDSIIQLPSTPASGVVVRVYRETDANALRTIYSTPTVLDHRDWNRVLTQLLYVTQEAFDANAGTAAQLDGVIEYINSAVAAAADSAASAATSAESAESLLTTAQGVLTTTQAMLTEAVGTVDAATTSGVTTLNALVVTLQTQLSDYADTLKPDLDAYKTAASASASAAASSETNSAAHEAKAEAWAESDEEVETGKHSAKYWAEQAAESASGSAVNISYTPSSHVESTNVQDAITELGDGIATTTTTLTEAIEEKLAITDKASSSDITTGTDDAKYTTSKAVHDAMVAYINASRVGETVIDSTGRDPDRALLKDGSLVSRTTYAGLWNYVSSTAVSEAAWSGGQSGRFSVGDGSTNFRLPDDRGAFLRGLDGGRGLDSGRAQGTYQADDLKSHNHSFTDSAFGGGSSNMASDGSIGMTDLAKTTGSTGGTETRPKNNAVRFFVRF